MREGEAKRKVLYIEGGYFFPNPWWG